MIGVIGINHEAAPVEIRERFSIDPDRVLPLSAGLKQEESLSEIVLLSTCNRSEIYFVSKKECAASLRNSFINAVIGNAGNPEGLWDYFYFYMNEGAIAHLLKVASGLDSMVLGENQILGQVREAYRNSTQGGFTGVVLNRLFHRAMETGKRVRAETAINESASSISYAAVELCGKIFENLRDHPLLLVGAGETGELVLKSLKERGGSRVTIANRSYDRAVELSSSYNAKPGRLVDLTEFLVQHDIIITSTSSKEPIILTGIMKRVMRQRKNRPIFLIDLSVPRNIEYEIRDLDNAFLYDIDDLEIVVARNREKRRAEITKAEAIVTELQLDFEKWLQGLQLGPTIAALKKKFDGVNDTELKRLENRLPEPEFHRVAEYGTFLKGKYFGMLIKNLKLLAANGENPEYVELVKKLFELEDDS
ncbi:MAG: glutamyl-tRNA reductase [Spirochaetales bacterium]|nr:glutamyl-tRNA reductase [Spirochaetales bacterium]